jgi:hypothetical protein
MIVAGPVAVMTQYRKEVDAEVRIKGVLATLSVAFDVARGRTCSCFELFAPPTHVENSDSARSPTIPTKLLSL